MENTLTFEKLERIVRCRLRYLAGEPVPGSDLVALGMLPNVASAREVLGVYLGAAGEPRVEEPGLSLLVGSPLMRFDGVVP